KQLFARIEAFSLDKADADLTFSQRLATENNWNIEYANRVIEEYKKFVFLAVVTGHIVTPSEQVD
ncbi:MAG: TIGR04222 domain-containing membrane protein, partial [Cyanobacteria bacterium J06638_38]